MAVLVALWVMFVPVAAAAPIGVVEEPSLESVALEAPRNPEPLVPPSNSPPVVVHKKATSTEALLERIGECESGNTATARNRTTTAKGRFQFLDGTWKHYGIELWGTLAGHSVMNYDDNTELARYVINTYGTGDWNASRGCWSI